MSESATLGMTEHPENSGGDGKAMGLPVNGIHLEWDRCDALRQHLRADGAVLFGKTLNATVSNSCIPHIHGFLKTMLVRMAELPGRPQPHVEPLRDELALLYRTMSKQVIDDTQIIHDSFMTRKFLGLVKMKTRIQKPSTDTHPHNRQPCLLHHASIIH